MYVCSSQWDHCQKLSLFSTSGDSSQCIAENPKKKKRDNKLQVLLRDLPKYIACFIL